MTPTLLRTNRLSLEEVRQLLAAQAASMQRTGLDQPPIQREGGSSEPQGAATPQRQTDYQAGYLDDLLDDLVDVIQMLVAADEPILSLVRALFSGPHRASQLEAVRAIAPEAKRSRISNLLT